MAKAAADYLAERDVMTMFTCPLERARENGAARASRQAVQCVEPDGGQSSSSSHEDHFEGLVSGVRGRLAAAAARALPSLPWKS